MENKSGYSPARRRRYPLNTITHRMAQDATTKQALRSEIVRLRLLLCEQGWDEARIDEEVRRLEAAGLR